jgi:FKBP-type peptidyl-prolyl cis-trans isomerase SlyD
MTFESVPGEPADGELYTVTDITDEVVILDGNHPLAGMSLRFDLEVDDLREATNEEVAAEIERQKPD